MARLRVRVELNRGGVGVPMHKLASVVQQAQTFFEMLAQDVHIQKDRGEWLASDFENESLNFTAEFVGPVSAEQASDFCAAFDGVTSLRRATIAQFTRIADAIGEDELIGFGLYQSEHEVEPSEWRCLSRRDALRIADEIQLLLGVSGEQDQETHLPAVNDAGVGARVFKERRDRSLLSAEQSKWPNLVREVESNLTKRINRIEGEVESHTHAIRDIRETSAAAEESFKGLLSAVENFCGQATRQLEKLSPASETGLQSPPQLSAASTLETSPVEDSRGGNWRAVAIAAVILLSVATLIAVFWTSKSSEASIPETAPAKVQAPVQTPPQKAIAEKSTLPAEPSKPKAAGEPVTKPKQAAVAAKLAKPSDTGATSAQVMHVEIEATEPVWVSVTDTEGNTLLARTLQASETRNLELTKNATLRTGNAGGLVIRFNGKDIGPLGPNGKIRDVQFKDGHVKIGSAEAGASELGTQAVSNPVQ